MNPKSRPPHADAHRKASDEFRGLDRDQQRVRLQEAGVLGVTPRVGDTVRVERPGGQWHAGIIVGADERGVVHVAHNDEQRGGVVTEPLHAFAGGQRVEMIRRAAPAHEYDVAARALELRGRRYDRIHFNGEHFVEESYRGARPVAAAVGVLLAAAGLVFAAALLSDDHEWDENVARYRDARGRFRRA